MCIRCFLLFFTLSFALSAWGKDQFQYGELGGTAPERRAKIAKENSIANKTKLPRYKSLQTIVGAQLRLQRIPTYTDDHIIDHRVHKDRRYLQPWAAAYLAELARDFVEQAGRAPSYQKLKVSSLVRDLQYQHRLGSRSAAQCKEAATCSTHLTGATFDISFRRMSKRQKTWMYRRLAADMKSGRVRALYEGINTCFHIFVIPPHGTIVAAEPPATKVSVAPEKKKKQTVVKKKPQEKKKIKNKKKKPVLKPKPS